MIGLVYSVDLCGCIICRCVFVNVRLHIIYVLVQVCESLEYWQKWIFLKWLNYCLVFV